MWWSAGLSRGGRNKELRLSPVGCTGLKWQESKNGSRNGRRTLAQKEAGQAFPEHMLKQMSSVDLMGKCLRQTTGKPN